MEKDKKTPTNVDLQLLLDKIARDGRSLGMSDQEIKRLQQDCINTIGNRLD